MIQYTLKCAEGHRFDSWFQSASAYDKLRRAGHVSCAVCGSSEVEKAMMAPRVSSGEAQPPAPAKTPLSQPKSPAEQALAALKAHVEKNSDYVGRDFAREARAMHVGETPERPIWGEARADEAKALAEEGVPIAPLPFTPSRRSN
ncbi:DUF1178 family protein [Pseudoponticoccus marisrubri]|uniref:Uncharacterized protein n=1 Tax=Pseudoponticoccus marisrubri TaxID=1685382 RepID=A0A0W7WHY6_9RHOB|nr:DUF1178 family protein [Pseudoponticoccus marisrubri]KUF10235.1 hypothetical protein AVJ23_12545 [Pseudoponticoccus marisrubri]